MIARKLLAFGTLVATLVVPALASAQTYYPPSAYGPPTAYVPSQAYTPPVYYPPTAYAPPGYGPQTYAPVYAPDWQARREEEMRERFQEHERRERSGWGWRWAWGR